MKNHLLTLFFLIIISSTDSEATRPQNKLSVNAGINIGGATPMPLPVEIRQIKSYSPGISPSIGISSEKNLSGSIKWAIQNCLQLELKSMNTTSDVKNYHIQIIGTDGEHIAGNWTGSVDNMYSGLFFTYSPLMSYSAGKALSIEFGPWLSYLIRGRFKGEVYDGYLRENDPTGNKILFDSDNAAGYNFSDNLRHAVFGIETGITYKLESLPCHLRCHLTCGLNDIFKDNYNTITFAMKTVYINIGLVYQIL